LYSTESIKKYVEQLYLLLPKSRAWGRIFQTPQSLFVQVADHYPEMDSPYSGDPASAPVNPNTTTLGKLLSIFAIQMLRVDESIYALQEEMNGSISVDNLEEWENIYRISDTTGTLAERQANIQTIIDDRQIPRTFTYIEGRATANGAAITLQNVLDTNYMETGGDPENFDGNEWDPWSGQCGIGECGAVTCGNVGWGGFVRITIGSLGDYESDDAMIRDITPQIHAGTMVEWVSSLGDIIMTTSATDTYFQTTDALDTITQAVI